MISFDRKNTPTYNIIYQIFDRPFSTEYEFAIDWELDTIGPPIEDGSVSEEGDESLIEKRQENDRMQVVADLPGVARSGDHNDRDSGRRLLVDNDEFLPPTFGANLYQINYILIY